MSTQAAEFTALKENFVRVCKRILKENLTTNRSKHVEYLHDLIESYNTAISYIHLKHKNYTPELKQLATEELKYLRGKVKRCYTRLDIDEALPTDSYFTPLNLELILKYYSTSEIQISFTEGLRTPALTPASSTGSIQLLFENEIENPNMAMTNVEFLALASKTINTPYDGNPLTLNAFINSIEILKEVVPNNLAQMFFKVVKSKLTGKALDLIPNEINTVDGVIEILTGKIKPDNSKVVAGRLLALRADKSKMTEFTDQAEKLADVLQRSLIIEGITHDKAKEMTIEKTVELCRNATRSDLVKSILAATKFDSPKEVVAKYVIEGNTEEKEKQILQFKSYQKRGNGNGNGYNKNKNFRYSQNKNGNQNYQNYQNSNYRGRGKFRGRGRGRGSYNGNFNRNQSQQYVRYSENLGGPSQEGRASQTPPTQNVDGQIFHIPFQGN